MNGTNLFKIALRALANNKLRAFLTMLGIIIGVASVIAMLAIGQGSKRSIQQQISEMGSNMIMIHPGAEMRGGVRQDLPFAESGVGGAAGCHLCAACHDEPDAALGNAGRTPLRPQKSGKRHRSGKE